MRPIHAIDDPDDPRIAVFRAVRERDLAGRQEAFIAEGEVVLNVLARGGLYRARSLLLAEKRVPALGPLIDAFAADVLVYAARQAVMDEIAGFPIHRGILAAGERGPRRSAEALLAGLRGPAIVVAMFGLSNHDNVGGIFRNAAAFGAGAVLLDGACCDPLYRKAIRVSVGGVLTVPHARLAPDPDPLALLERHGFEALALSPSALEPLSSIRAGRRLCILLGAEGPGLPASLLARARSVSIPMAAGFDSLNVATASGIALHHLASVLGRR